MENKKITLEELKNFGSDVHKALKYIESFEINGNFKYPLEPRKPTEDSVLAYKKYVTELEKYEKEKEEICNKIKEEDKFNSELWEHWDEYIRGEAGFYDYVPEQYRAKIAYKAYEDGHSDGKMGEYYELCKLVNIFKP